MRPAMKFLPWVLVVLMSCVSEKKQSTVSKHLTILYDNGILDRKIIGKWTYYSIKNTTIFLLLKELDQIALDNASYLSNVVKKPDDFVKIKRKKMVKR